MAGNAQDKFAIDGVPKFLPADILLLIGRCCLAFEFVLYGTRKFLHPDFIAERIASHGLPADLIHLVYPFQFGFGMLVVLGLFTRVGAMALAFFCTLAPAIFLSDRLDSFVRDIGSAGGFLFLYAFGPGRISLDAKFGITCESIFGRRTDGAREMSILLLLGRAFMSLEFFHDGLAKLSNLSAAQDFFSAHGIMPALAAPCAVFELAVAVLVLSGTATRLAATGGFIAAAIFGFGFHNPGADLGIGTSGIGDVIGALFTGMNSELGSFAKDVGNMGAYLALLVCGPGALSVDAFRTRRKS